MRQLGLGRTLMGGDAPRRQFSHPTWLSTRPLPAHVDFIFLKAKGRAAAEDDLRIRMSKNLG